MTPIYYDCEFTGLSKDTTLISIGLVSHRNSYFYAEFTDYDKSQLNDWLQVHVIDNLLYNNEPTHFYRSGLRKTIPATGDKGTNTFVYDIAMKGDKENIAHLLNKWLINERTAEDPTEQLQIYTDCYAYDWVLFNDLLSPTENALDLPSFINYIPIDLSTLMFTKGVDPDVTREDFIYPDSLSKIKEKEIFRSKDPEMIKHNSLWDAFVAKECFYKLFRK